MRERTRPVPQPTVERDGSLVAHTVATPTAFKVRARVTIGSRKVIPVIFVPGIMGSNLRVRTGLKPAGHTPFTPGEPAWRPPNGILDGGRAVRKWTRKSPAERQRLLDPDILEVDPDGDLAFAPYSFERKDLRERGWGEVHAGSYGALLADLQAKLDKTFSVTSRGDREIRQTWLRVMHCEPSRWGVRAVDSITQAELEKYAAYQYPVYAFGYNWLASCEVSARRLRARIDWIKRFWSERRHECKHVILVTHSMGGLVARACARLSEPGDGSAPDIAGVVHSVMPALGAPVAYRRLACGTEGGYYTNGMVANIRASMFAEIAGDTSAETTPVMARSPGVLQLLPNHWYPRPWLAIKTVRTVNQKDEVRDVLSLPDGNPYDFYRDMDSWYRMIDPALADPSGKRNAWSHGGIKKAILAAIGEAERFHTKLLTVGSRTGATRPYYHPNTYVVYGADPALKTYGQIRWVAREPAGSQVPLTPANIRAAVLADSDERGGRHVDVERTGRLRFSIAPQDTHGDETVPVQSGAAPTPYVRAAFAPTGFRHQDSFLQSDMLLLTRHIIVKIVQGIQ